MKGEIDMNKYLIPLAWGGGTLVPVSINLDERGIHA